MTERRGSSDPTRQCSRSGCTAVAVATYTFDTETRTVWLDTPLEGNARAGELCGRHARLLTPPRGWQLEDRRGSAAPTRPPPPLRREREVVESLAPHDAPRPAKVPARQLAAGPAGRELEDELRGLLDAHSPLLSRAFRSSGTI